MHVSLRPVIIAGGAALIVVMALLADLYNLQYTLRFHEFTYSLIRRCAKSRQLSPRDLSRYTLVATLLHSRQLPLDNMLCSVDDYELNKRVPNKRDFWHVKAPQKIVEMIVACRTCV